MRKQKEKVVPFVVPPSKKEQVFVVYIDQKAGGGVYGWQPYASCMLEGGNGQKTRDGCGLQCSVPFKELGIDIEYGDRFMLKITRMRRDDEIYERGEKAEREYKAKERAHLGRTKKS